MAGNLWGADVAQLRTLAQQFGKTSETLLQQSTTLTSAINGNTSWKGADGARFTSEWNGSHRALIQKTALALKEESKRLMTHAEQQEKASNNGSGSGAPGTPGARAGQGTHNNPWGPDWLAGRTPHSAAAGTRTTAFSGSRPSRWGFATSPSSPAIRR